MAWLRRWWTGGERPQGPVVVSETQIHSDIGGKLAPADNGANLGIEPALDVLGAASLPGRFHACLPIILRHEGGYVDHPRDPGGCTNWGITRATLEGWRTRPTTCADVRALTVQEAGAIYRARYWRAVQADALPPGVDLLVFDGAVNSGPGQAIRWLQRAVGVADDGRIGPVTLAAVRRHSPGAMIFAIAGARMAFLRRLSTWDAFGRGWERRVMDVQAEALRMAKLPA